MKYFETVFEMVNKSRQERNKSKSSLSLEQKLELAESIQKQVHDTWDYQSIQKDIEELKLQMQMSRQRPATKEPRYFLSDKEINQALDNHAEDMKRLKVEYNELWNAVKQETDSYLKSVVSKINEIQKLERLANSAGRIKEHIPSIYSQSLDILIERKLQIDVASLASSLYKKQLDKLTEVNNDKRKVNNIFRYMDKAVKNEGVFEREYY